MVALSSQINVVILTFSQNLYVTISDWNETRTQNILVLNQILNHLAEWFSIRRVRSDHTVYMTFSKSC